MLKNYLKIALRSLNRNKINSIINISGLAIGLACVLLIGLYIKDELSYDSAFNDANRIYRVNTHEKIGTEEFTAGHTPPPTGAALTSNFPEVESYTRIFKPMESVVKYVVSGQTKSITERKILSVDSNFLEFFSYDMVDGDRKTCLNNPYAVVLTESAAHKYFGNTPAIGKNLEFDGYKAVVTAIMKDIPKQSSLQFDVLQSIVGVQPIKRFSWSWIWLQMGTYVKLKANVASNPEALLALQAKFPAMVKVQAASAFNRIGQPFDDFIRKGGKYEIKLQPLTDVHLYSANIGSRFIDQADVKYLYIFGAIALFIMLLACVNFMNLSTAQSAKRAKEVGIRKVLGSERKQLIGQFLAEALVYTLFAAVIAIALVILCLPAFNNLSSKSLSINSILNFLTLGGLLVAVIITALLAGSYPAFLLTSFKPVTVLKGSSDSNNSLSGFLTRNVLVVFQFTVSTVLIICTIVVYKQLIYNQSKDLGFDKENVLVVNNAGRLGTSEESFRQELLRMSEISAASVTTNLPAENTAFTDTYIPESINNASSAEKKVDLSSFIVDDSFVPALKLKMKSGRNFSTVFADSASVILNETAAKQMGWKDPIAKYMVYPGGNGTRFKVIGIVKDFNTESLHSIISPYALFYTTSKTYSIPTSYVIVRIKSGDYNKTVSKVQALWKRFMPTSPFEYTFLDEQYNSLYRTDQTISRVFTVFTFLSITIACLGLLGLAMYTAERRTKEIGIRKVLGASVKNVIAMLSIEFLKLAIIASLIAFPVAWYAMNKWLQDFAYPTTMNWWVFGLAAGITLVIALSTISFQSIKAALMNPVKSLRSE